MANEVQTTGSHQSQQIDSNATIGRDEAPSLFEFTQLGLTDLTGKGSAPLDDVWQGEVNCIYILDDKVIDVAIRARRKAIDIDVSSFKMASTAFEILADGMLTLLPIALGISAHYFAFTRGIALSEDKATPYAKYFVDPIAVVAIERVEFQRRVQYCIELLCNRHLWQNDRIKVTPAGQIAGLVEQARQVRAQLGVRELASSCTICGPLLDQKIRIPRELGTPKPVVVTEVTLVHCGEVAGFHREFRVMHFVYGAHRKAVDICFDEEIFGKDVIEFSSRGKIVVEANWTEQRDDNIVRAMTLTKLCLVQEPLFPMTR